MSSERGYLPFQRLGRVASVPSHSTIRLLPHLKTDHRILTVVASITLDGFPDSLVLPEIKTEARNSSAQELGERTPWIGEKNSHSHPGEIPLL